jgi:hypothetical protein
MFNVNVFIRLFKEEGGKHLNVLIHYWKTKIKHNVMFCRIDPLELRISPPTLKLVSYGVM